MAFYSAITTMETDIKSVEIDIELLQNVAISSDTKYEIDFISRPRLPYKDYYISQLADELISDYSAINFNAIIETNLNAVAKREVQIKLAPTIIDQQISVISSDTFPDFKLIELGLNLTSNDSSQLKINIETFTDATMAFYSNIVTVETDIKSVEIDIELFKSISSNSITKYKIESVVSIDSQVLSTNLIEIDVPLNDRYYEKLIDDFFYLPLGLYDDQKLNGLIALGRSTFETKVNGDVYYQDMRLMEFEETNISQLQSIDIDDRYTNKIVTKNKKIPGTVNVSGNTISGTGTDFDIRFLVNDSIIIESEKFIVKTISNSEHIVLNTIATTNYTNVPAYREYFV
jgi:hypothetical protein